jgi:Phage integrase family
MTYRRCKDGWICEEHPDKPWPHDDCAGPGVQCPNPECPWWKGDPPANLTFHDLRHEAGSRLLEAGWPLHNVAHMLGHANIAQTSTYLNATRVGLQDAMRRLDASRSKPVENQVAAERSTEQRPIGEQHVTLN